MKNILEKLKSRILELEKEHGPFIMFAMFLREEPLEKWDILVSASWLSNGQMESYRTIAEMIQNTLKDQEIIQISRIVILNSDDPVVSYLQDNFPVTNGGYKEVPIEEISSEKISSHFGFSIKKAFVLRCSKNDN